MPELPKLQLVPLSVIPIAPDAPLPTNLELPPNAISFILRPEHTKFQLVPLSVDLVKYVLETPRNVLLPNATPVIFTVGVHVPTLHEIQSSPEWI